jgi:hypothetical protein
VTIASRRLIAAVLVSAFQVLSAPWIGTIRASIQTAFPGRFGLIVNTLVAGAILVAAATAVLRIRTQRGRRYLALAAALCVTVGSAALTATPSASQNAVERFHFVSFGLITFLFYRAVRSDAVADLSTVALPALAALLVGAVDEWFQWLIPGRFGELRDIFLNAAAIAAGLLFSVGIAPPSRFLSVLQRRSVRRLALTTAALVIVLALFMQVVHLGYEIHDEEIGTFRSRYARHQLSDLAIDRHTGWQLRPPPLQIPRLAWEDQYLAEGIWHIMARNTAWPADVHAAWAENLILEKYFAPVLDTPSYAAGVSRWPAAQRADAEARVRAFTAPRPFVSRAERHPIRVWPSWWLWGAALGLAAPLIIVAWRAQSGVDR